MVFAMIGAILVGALPLQNRIGRLIGYYLITALPAGKAAMMSFIVSANEAFVRAALLPYTPSQSGSTPFAVTEQHSLILGLA